VRSWLRYYAAHFDTVELNSPFYFNNDGRAAAVRNAGRLIELLDSRARRRVA